jgi:hypothetical protein
VRSRDAPIRLANIERNRFMACTERSDGEGAKHHDQQGKRTYHRRRRRVTLGRLTPTKYETVMPTAAAQAAERTCHQIVEPSTSWSDLVAGRANRYWCVVTDRVRREPPLSPWTRSRVLGRRGVAAS